MSGPSRRSSAWPSCTRGSDFVVTRDVMARARCKTRMCGSFGQNPLWFRMLGSCLPPSLSAALRGSIQNVKNFHRSSPRVRSRVLSGSEGDFCEQAFDIHSHEFFSHPYDSAEWAAGKDVRDPDDARGTIEARDSFDARSSVERGRLPRRTGRPAPGVPRATLAPTWNPVTCASQRLGHRRPGRQQSGHR